MRKHLGKIITFFLIVAIVVFVYFVVGYNRSGVAQQATKVEPPGIPMIAKYEPSGTQISKDSYLKIRIDLYPTQGNKTYAGHHIQVPVMPPEGYPGKVDESGSPLDINDYDKWIEGLSKTWQVNPVLSHFVKVNPNITKEELAFYLNQIFDKSTVHQLDDLLSQPKTDLKGVSLLMQFKGGTGNILPENFKLDSIREQLNARLSGLEVEVGK